MAIQGNDKSVIKGGGKGVIVLVYEKIMMFITGDPTTGNKKAVLSTCAGHSYKRITVRPSARTGSNVLFNYLKTNAIIVLVAAKFQ